MELPMYTASDSKRAQISFTPRWKPEVTNYPVGWVAFRLVLNRMSFLRNPVANNKPLLVIKKGVSGQQVGSATFAFSVIASRFNEAGFAHGI